MHTRRKSTTEPITIICTPTPFIPVIVLFSSNVFFIENSFPNVVKDPADNHRLVGYVSFLCANLKEKCNVCGDNAVLNR